MNDDNVSTKSRKELRAELRKDAAYAQQRFELLLPDLAARQVCLNLLADSIEIAHGVRPSLWGLTLRDSKRIRLNVGKFVAVGIDDGDMFIALRQAQLSEDEREMLNSHVKWLEHAPKLGGIGCKFPAKQLPQLLPNLKEPHRYFLLIASGGITQTPYWPSHSPGAIIYLREALNRPSLPDPIYSSNDENTEAIEEEDEETTEPSEQEGTTSTAFIALKDKIPPRPSIYDYLRAQQLHFPAELVTTYLLSLKTKPFVILSGISGTGKTKLAQAIAEWARSTQPGDARYHEFISVRPDWLDGKEVLGFYNVLTEEYSIRPFASLLLRAHRSPEQPHFAILDEMNLARVEHYFADLLSATESRTVKEGKLRQEAVHLHDDARCLPMAKPKNWNRPEKCGACKATTEEVAACDLYFDNVQMVPPNLPVPANVYITGTVNIDETTHMFSPKVLDRANVIEFNEVDLLGYGQTNPSSEFMLDNGDIDLGKATVAQQEHFKNAPEKVQTTLAALNQLLAESNLHFGYRVANEISLYVTHAVTFVGTNAVDAALDLQVLQKVLPKLHGSKQKLLGPLWRLLVFAVWGNSNPIPYSDQEFEKIQSSLANSASMPAMPRTAAKLARMLRVLRSQGFVSFIE